MSKASSHSSAAQKLVQRGGKSLGNLIRNLLPPLINFFVAWWIIHTHSKELWGEVVGVLIFVSLSTSLLSWGNKEYLLRYFSREPARLASLWQSSVATRIGFLLIPTAAMVLFYAPELWLWLGVWLVSSFLFQSLDVVVVYTRRFRTAMLAEIMALGLLMGGLWWNRQALDLTEIVKWWGFSIALKSVLLFLVHRSVVVHSWQFKLNREHLTIAFPFLLIGLSGLLQSKTDLYVVNYFLDEEQVGIYQVTINGFLYIQAFAGFAITPFAKNLYRLPAAKVRRMSFRYGLIGVGVLFFAIPLCWGLLNVIYDFDHPWQMFLYGALYVWPSFFFLPLILLWYGQGKEKWVMWVNFGGAGLNLILTILLIPYWNIEGALIASAAAQWGMWMVFLFYGRKKSDQMPTRQPADRS